MAQSPSTAEPLTLEQLRIERIMFGLRTDGVDKKDIEMGAEYDLLIQEKLIFEDGEKIKVNSNWIFLIDYIIEKLI